MTKVLNITMENLQVGDTFKTNQGGSVVVLEIQSSRRVYIQHNDGYLDSQGFGYKQVVKLQRLNTGEIKNPYFPSVMGVGFLGEGCYNSKHKQCYKAWATMLARVYCPKTREKQPSYTNTSLSRDWHNFQNFASWYYSQPYIIKGYHVDKDILSEEGKIYSAANCCLVPQEVNKLFILRGDESKGTPIGVQFRNNRYTVKAGQAYIGSYETKEEASLVYAVAKAKHIRVVLSLFRTKLDQRVVEALIKLSSEYLKGDYL